MYSKIQSLYWSIVPYNYRPHNIWYSIKCAIWHKYTTVKPRWLSHHFCDKTELMPFLLFECLCDFVEKERPFDAINWDHDDTYKFIRDEIIELYAWFLCTYIPWFEESNGRGSKFSTPEIKTIRAAQAIINAGEDIIDSIAKGNEVKQEIHAAYKVISSLEETMLLALRHNCCRLIEISPYMWT